MSQNLARYDPVTFIAQTHVDGAWTTKICFPTVDSALTDCPDAPVSVIVGAPDGEAPAEATDT